MKFNFIILMVLFLVVGCSSVAPKQPKLYRDISKPIDLLILRSPEIDVLSSVEIGENMYEKSYLKPQNTFTVKILSDLTIDNGKDRQYGWLILGVLGAVIMESTAENRVSDLEKDTFFQLTEWVDGGYKTVCDLNNKCLIDIDDIGIFTHSGTFPNRKLKKLEDGVKYKVFPSPPEFKEDSFKYVALYQGVVDGKIKISFREFKGNLARPAFSQDIEYELDNDGRSVIGFKGLRIHVEKATNLNIKYRVTKDYN